MSELKIQISSVFEDILDEPCYDNVFLMDVVYDEDDDDYTIKIRTSEFGLVGRLQGEMEDAFPNLNIVVMKEVRIGEDWKESFS